MKTPINRKVATAAFVTAALLFTGTACSSTGSSQPGKINTQQQGNDLNNTIGSWADLLGPYPYKNAKPTDPLELRNLAARLIQLNSKGATGYVYLFAPMSKDVIGYYVTRGKVSSTASQMTPTQAIVGCGHNTSYGQNCVVDSIGDDGSYGPSEGGQNGVFFFTSGGTLIETVLPWTWSSQPIKLYANAPMLGQ